MLETTIFAGEYVASADQVSGNAAEFGGKAANLAEMQLAGLPIPETFFISSKLHRYYREHGELPADFIKQLPEMRAALGGAVAVRSSANVEDGENLSLAGVFDSFYIEADEPDELVAARIVEIFGHVESAEVSELLGIHNIASADVEMGIVLQRLIPPKYAGVMYTNGATDQIVVQYLDDYGAALVDGQASGATVVLDATSSEIMSSSGFDDYPLSKQEVEALGQRANQVHEYYKRRNQDIEFVFEKETGELYLVQSRPHTAELGVVESDVTAIAVLEKTKKRAAKFMQVELAELGLSEAALSDSNFSELLPQPTEADYGVFAYIFTGLNGKPGAIQLGRREMGYPVGDETIGYMHYLGGKPYMSIARDAGTFFMGVPETRGEYYSSIVSGYLAAINTDRERGLYPEMGLYLQDPTAEQLAELFPEHGAEYYQTYLTFVEGLGEAADTFLGTFAAQRLPDLERFYQRQSGFETALASPGELLDFIDGNLEYMRTQACVDFVKAARLGFYYTQRLQVELIRKLGYDEERVRETLVLLTQGLDGSKITEVNLEIAAAEDHDTAITLACKLVGHYSTGEALEIRHSRFADELGVVVDYVTGLRSADYTAKFGQQRAERLAFQAQLLADLPDAVARELEAIITNAQKYMALRETVKYYFTKGYAEVRRGMVELAERTNTPVEQIFHLYPNELRAFAAQASSMRHLLKARASDYAHYHELDLPNVFMASDISSLKLKVDSAEEFEQAVGKFIARGEDIEAAVIINLEEFDLTSPEFKETVAKYRDAGIPIVLVAKQVNLTHDALINISAGLILENADLVSHGAQRARELGIGAISGVRVGKLKTGMRVSFSPEQRLIKRIASDE